MPPLPAVRAALRAPPGPPPAPGRGLPPPSGRGGRGGRGGAVPGRGASRAPPPHSPRPCPPPPTPFLSPNLLRLAALVIVECTADGAAARAAVDAPIHALSPGPEIWVGAAIPVAVFALGAWEFTKRILIQRACAVCGGTGLVRMGGEGSSTSSPPRLVKCRACGGFFPWQSWGRFLSSAPGNGGPLQQPTLPRQGGLLYRVPTPAEAAAAAVEAGVKQQQEGGGSGNETTGQE